MRPHEVSPVPVEGQFWANTAPLSLMQCVTRGDPVSGFKAWYPHGIQGEDDLDPVYLVLPSITIKFLWCRARLTGDRLHAVFGDHVPNVGDVWLLRGSNDLFFVGPESTAEEVYVYADWDCLEGFTETEVTLFFTQLFQPGPGGRALPPPAEAPSAVDRLLRDDALV